MVVDAGFWQVPDGGFATPGFGRKGELCKIDLESGVQEMTFRRMYENLEENKVANVKGGEEDVWPFTIAKVVGS